MPAQIGLITSPKGADIAPDNTGDKTSPLEHIPEQNTSRLNEANTSIDKTMQETQDNPPQHTGKPTQTDNTVTQEQPQPALPAEESLTEQIEQLKEQILSEEEFDFSQLEASAAGPELQTSLGSPPLIETSETIIAYHSADNLVSQDSPTLTEITTSGTSPGVISNTDNENTLLTTRPSLIGERSAQITEDYQPTQQGSIDTPYPFVANTQTTGFGEISYNEQGDWHYTLNNQLADIQALGAGDTLSETIELVARNGASFFIELTINGSNDQAIITGDTQHTIYEDAANNQEPPVVEVSGNLTVQDTDTGQARFIVNSDITTTYGKAEINAQGEWHYELNNTLSAVQSLSKDDSLNDYFSVRTVDGSSQTVKITIQGTDDSPFLSGTNRVELDLSHTDTVSGQLTINDPDFGESHFQTSSNLAGRFGLGSIDENGHWSYQVNTELAEISNLEAGKLLYDTFSVMTADGSNQTIIIPITNNPETEPVTGTNNASSVNIDDNLPVIELNPEDQLLSFTTSSASDTHADVYIWDADTLDNDSALRTNTIQNFTTGSGGDILQLNDLLIETNHENELDQFLHFSFNGQDTTIEINVSGKESSSNATPEPGDTHYLVLNNLDLTSFGNTDTEIIQQLVQQGNLDIAGI